MPPIRRYLRITRYTVLECRIYLDNPADAHRWLVSPRSPVLPRVIEAVRPLVLPKLREENAKAKGGGKGKKKGWKDVVVQDDFEVAVFLTETSTRHSILRKEKRVKGEKARLGTTDGKLTGTRDAPVEVAEGGPGISREESDETEGVRMADLPAASPEIGNGAPHIPKQESREELFVSDDESGDDDAQMTENSSGRKRKEPDAAIEIDDQGDDEKKKMGLATDYDGFSIYGRILCLVVKRKDNAKGKGAAGDTGPAMMEEWIASTQVGEDRMMDD